MLPSKPRTPRHWLPLLPALATLLMLAAVIWGNDQVVTRELEQRAQLRVSQAASSYADRMGRVLARRGAELSLLGHLSVAVIPLPEPVVQQELRRVLDDSPAYVWIGLVDTSGRLRLSTDDRVAGPSVPPSRWPHIARQKPWFGAMQTLWDPLPEAPAGMDAGDWLGALAVPLISDQQQLVGHLVALMSRTYFESRRQFDMGEPAIRRQQELSLMAADGTRLQGPELPFGASAWAQLRQLPRQGAVARKDSGGESWWLAAAPIAPTESPLATDWFVAASQPMKAATAPADRLESGLIAWGLGTAVLIGAAGMWLARRITRPYEEVLQAVERHGGQPLTRAPGAYLQAVSAALTRLGPSWTADDGQQALLGRVLQDARRLQTVLEHLPTPVYMLDARQQVVFWNQQAQQVFGWTRSEALGRPVDELIPGSVHERTQQPGNDAPTTFEALTTSRDGQAIWCEWRLLPLGGGQDPDLGLVVMARDVSDRVRARTALVQHQVELSHLNQRLLEQEQENSRRMAQTLHDRLGQTLGAMRLTYDAMATQCQESLSPRLVQRAQALGDMIDRAIREVRQALVELRPPLLEDEGLAVALDNEVRAQQPGAEPTRLGFELLAPQALPRWPADVEYAAFMVAREAISNALRHADAQHISVQLEGGADWLRLRVNDDGRGMPHWPAPAQPGHLGLVGMRERALAIGARLDFLAATPSGLRVLLQWPHPRSVDPAGIGQERP